MRRVTAKPLAFAVLDKGTAEGIKVQTRSSWHGKGSDFLMDKLFRMHVALITL